MLAKENGIVLPLLLVGIGYMKEGRRILRGRTTLWVGCVLAILLAVLIRFVIMSYDVGQAGPLSLKGTFPEKIVMMIKIQGIYLQSLFYLRAFLPNMGGELLTGAIDLDFLWAVVFWVGLFVWAALLRRRSARVAVLFYMIAMGPVSNIITLNNPVAFRYLYFPALGLYFLLALTLQALMGKISSLRRFQPLLLVLLIGVPAVFSCLWNRYWKDEVSLWGYHVSHVPEYYRPWADLAVAQNNQGLYADAARSARAALALKPDYFYAWSALGTSQLYRSRYQDALASYREALRHPCVKGSRADVYFGMGYALEGINRSIDAKKEYQEALKENPLHIGALNNLAILYCQEEDFEAAKPLLERVLKINPRDQDACFNLVLVYHQEGDKRKVRAYLNQILKFDPNNARARKMLKSLDK
jgi:tetratricopeptide (TPR) repeat protein